MKQLLLRVPDDLHARLTERALVEQRSVNALASEILDVAVDATGATSQRNRYRAKARQLGILVEYDYPPTDKTIEELLDQAASVTRGIGPIMDELWKEGR